MLLLALHPPGVKSPPKKQKNTINKHTTFIFLIDAAIVAGNTLSGKVLLLVQDDIHVKDHPSTDLYLHLAGTEQATVQKGIKIFTALRFVFSSHVVLSQRSQDDEDVHNGGIIIEQGSYGFPFSIDLPTSLPSSTYAKSAKRGSPSNCKIEVRDMLLKGVIVFGGREGKIACCCRLQTCKQQTMERI